jgi:hypothetical protein
MQNFLPICDDANVAQICVAVVRTWGSCLSSLLDLGPAWQGHNLLGLT